MNEKVKWPRGMRNNNPLNIRRNSKSKWVGEVDKLSYSKNDTMVCDTVYSDRVFCQFSELKYGWRAAFILLKRYINVLGCNTVETIIKRWAPENENNTKGYINRVAFDMNIGVDEPILFANRLAMYQLASAMCRVENGYAFDPANEATWINAMANGYTLAEQCGRYDKPKL